VKKFIFGIIIVCFFPPWGVLLLLFWDGADRTSAEPMPFERRWRK